MRFLWECPNFAPINSPTPFPPPAPYSRLLIDTGDADHPAYIEHLNGVLSTEQARVSAILLTHWHHDHIGGCGDVLRAIDGLRTCPVWKFPRTDAPDHYPLEIPAGVQLHPLADRQEFAVDGATLRVMHTPGHTTDHVCVELLEERALFSGDCILGEGTAVFEDLYEYMLGLQRIERLAPARIYPAHGNLLANPAEAVRYYLRHRDERECQIVAAMEAPDDWRTRTWTKMEVVRSVYGSEVPEALWPAAAVNVQHHLRKLCREGYLEELVGAMGAEEGAERVWRVVRRGGSER